MDVFEDGRRAVPGVSPLNRVAPDMRAALDTPNALGLTLHPNVIRISWEYVAPIPEHVSGLHVAEEAVGVQTVLDVGAGCATSEALKSQRRLILASCLHHIPAADSLVQGAGRVEEQARCDISQRVDLLDDRALQEEFLLRAAAAQNAHRAIKADTAPANKS